MTEAMNGCVAVFDIGKTNMKVVVFDAAGKVVAERVHPNATLLPDARCPYRSLATEGAWRFLVGALKELGAQFPIEAISISAHGAAAVMVADQDFALRPVDYEFDIDPEIAAEYDKLRPPFEETLSPNLPRGLNLGRQVYYLQRRYPAEFAAARALLGYPQYWSWRLSGVAATEFTAMGARTRAARRAWSTSSAGGGSFRRSATPGTPSEH
jgi:sugar (pentulose or hexulose) kinase